MNEKLRLIRTVSNRLVSALAVLLCIIIPGSFYALYHGGVPTALAIFTVGVVGGVVGLQRRLKTMSDDDLTLLANSWVYVCLSPLTGGILAVVTYILFVSGMLQGELFPHFVPDDPTNSEIGLPVLFKVHCATDIISRFESNATSEK